MLKMIFLPNYGWKHIIIVVTIGIINIRQFAIFEISYYKFYVSPVKQSIIRKVNEILCIMNTEEIKRVYIR